MPNQWQDFINLLSQNVAPPTEERGNFIPRDSSLNFEQRVLNPKNNPALISPDGSVATHKMAWDDFMGRNIAFPTIIQNKAGGLTDLGKDAYAYALKTGEYRQFKSPKEAEAYASGGYKSQWDSGNPRPMDWVTRR